MASARKGHRKLLLAWSNYWFLVSSNSSFRAGKTLVHTKVNFFWFWVDGVDLDERLRVLQYVRFLQRQGRVPLLAVDSRGKC